MNAPEIISTSWSLDEIYISHHIVHYDALGTYTHQDDTDHVRLHFGLQGAYDFSYKELSSSYQLSGHHNNIMYSKGMTLTIENKTKRIETFGINFSPSSFTKIANNGNSALQIMAEKVLNQQPAILSPEWKTNNFKIQLVINEILHCPYSDDLMNLFLFSKSLELLVLQAELYGKVDNTSFIKTDTDKEKLIAAKEIISAQINNPPILSELSKLVALNEYKLKRGFKELFGTSVFGYVHEQRMARAKLLLLETDKTAKEIAYETGYSSPQHFSKAFKEQFGLTPNSIRKAPNSIIRKEDHS